MAGIRTLGIGIIAKDEVQSFFLEFEPFEGGCKFGDCLHHSEPECVVKAAVRDGVIDSLRYESYLRLQSEVGA